MRRLIPSAEDEALEAVYRDLTLPTQPGRSWVSLGMVASVDGAASLAGDTSGLGGRADHHAFRALRGACDAILVGAGTVRLEDYRWPVGTSSGRQARVAKGLTPLPRLVIVSGSLDLDPGARVFSDPGHPPLIITHEEALAGRGARLRAVAEVMACGEAEVDLGSALGDLHARGLERILCEGGPTLNGELLRLDAVDEVFLTVDPVLVGGRAGRIVRGDAAEAPRRMRLVELREHAGELLLRYQRDRGGRADGPPSGG